MSIRITSDSTCDLNDLVVEKNIGILPLQVNLDATPYHDGVDITPQDIFKFVAETKILPKTSAPSIGDYEEFFEELFKEERHFAKRQNTWYGKENNVVWLDAKDNIVEKAIKLVEEFYNK